MHNSTMDDKEIDIDALSIYDGRVIQHAFWEKGECNPDACP